MGVSTDGLLGWGVVLGTEFEERFTEEVYPMMCRILNIEYDGLKSEPGMIELAEAGLEMQMHCHMDHPMWNLIARESEVCAWRGYPNDTLDLTPKPEWLSTFREVVDLPKLGISKQPGWILSSLWA